MPQQLNKLAPVQKGVPLYMIPWDGKFTVVDDEYKSVWRLERGDGMYMWVSSELDGFDNRTSMYMGTRVEPVNV